MENVFEMIVVFVNDGFSDVVMDAARKEGANGGTVMNCRGTANKEIEEKYGIGISEDKDMVLIIVPKEIKDKVIKSINENAGLKTDKHGIIFSLPISDAEGLNYNEK